MAILGKSNDGAMMDVIRCDQKDYLIWRWHPQGTSQDASKRAYSIRWGSSLRVKAGEVAVFVYSGGEGGNQDVIVGPYDKILETENLPVLASIVGMAYGGGAPFQAEVYFINCAQVIQARFGVPFFDVFDPRYLDFGVPMAVRGNISFKIKDVGEFIGLHRLTTFDIADFQGQIRSAVIRYVKEIVSNAPEEYGIPVVQIERKIGTINDIVESKIKGRLERDFGVEVTAVDIDAIEVQKQSEGYRSLLAVTKDVTTATVTAQKEATVREIHAQQVMGVIDQADRQRRDRHEDQYERHLDTQTSHMTAHRANQQADVAARGADALGKMGHGGGIGGGFNPAGIMAGLAVGGQIGQGVANTIGSAMSGFQQKINSAVPAQQHAQEPEQSQATSSPVAPPPVPGKAYHAVLNGKTVGPFDVPTIEQLAIAEVFTADTLVWSQGMEGWLKAAEVDDLKGLFGADETGSTPPPIPRA